MPSSIITTIIGTTVFIIVFFAVMGYASFRTQVLMRDSELATYGKIANSIAYQILLVMSVKSNNSALLNFPVNGAYERLYQVVVGNGTTLKNMYSFVSGVVDNYIYVLVVDPMTRSYGFAPIVENTTKVPVFIVKAQNLSAGQSSCSYDGYMLFTSNSAILVEKAVGSNKIFLSCKFMGVKTS